MKTLILILLSCFACQYNDISTETEAIDTVKVSVLLPGDTDEGGPLQEADSWIPPEPEPQPSPPGDPTINDPDNPNDDE